MIKKLDQKGVTLIEIIIVTLILGIISGIAYPLVFMENKVRKDQAVQTERLSDVRTATNFLKNDLRYAQHIVFSGDVEENPNTSQEESLSITIIDSTNQSIVYQLDNGDLRRAVFAEGVDPESAQPVQEILFENIRKSYFKKENDTLTAVTLVTCEIKNDCHQFKVARWQWEVAVEDAVGGFYDALNKGLFVVGNNYYHQGGAVSGKGATILVRDSLFAGNGGQKIEITNIFVDGNFGIQAGQLLGNSEQPGDIIINGSLTIGSANKIYGNLYVHGDLVINNTIEVFGKIFVKGDLHYNNGATLNEDVYVNGNLYINNTGTMKKNVYVNNSVFVNNNFTGFSINSKVYYYGNVTFPGSWYTQQNKFEKIDHVFSIELKEIPKYGIPKPRPFEWYASNNYEGGVISLANNKKIFVDGNYSFTSIGANISNVILISTGDVNIDLRFWGAPGSMLTGVIYAPYGKVVLKARRFEGIIIARDGLRLEGNNNIELEFRNINEYINNEADYPFLNEMYPPSSP